MSTPYLRPAGALSRDAQEREAPSAPIAMPAEDDGYASPYLKPATFAPWPAGRTHASAEAFAPPAIPAVPAVSTVPVVPAEESEPAVQTASSDGLDALWFLPPEDDEPEEIEEAADEPDAVDSDQLPIPACVPLFEPLETPKRRRRYKG